MWSAIWNYKTRVYSSIRITWSVIPRMSTFSRNHSWNCSKGTALDIDLPALVLKQTCLNMMIRWWKLIFEVNSCPTEISVLESLDMSQNCWSSALKFEINNSISLVKEYCLWRSSLKIVKRWLKIFSILFTNVIVCTLLANIIPVFISVRIRNLRKI